MQAWQYRASQLLQRQTQTPLHVSLRKHGCPKSVQILDRASAARPQNQNAVWLLRNSCKLRIMSRLQIHPAEHTSARAPVSGHKRPKPAWLFHKLIHRNRCDSTWLAYGTVGSSAGLFGRAPTQRIHPISGPRCSQVACRSDGGGITATTWFDGALSNPLRTAVT